MISFTSTELNAWIALYFFPLVRVLALMATAPPFNYSVLNSRTKLILGVAITFALAPLLPHSAVRPDTGEGLLILGEQMLIGVAMGFAARLSFSAIDLAGNIISYQMGLGFATSYDPANASQTPVVSELLGIIALLLFLAIDGHLMVLSTLAKSFEVLPIGALPGPNSWLNLANAVYIVFFSGLFLTLPIIVALLVTNTALGILGRVSPQLNLIVIGFPTTIALGFITLYVVLPYMSNPLLSMFETGLNSMLSIFVK